jgi:hypothetical protein
MFVGGSVDMAHHQDGYLPSRSQSQSLMAAIHLLLQYLGTFRKDPRRWKVLLERNWFLPIAWTLADCVSTPGTSKSGNQVPLFRSLFGDNSRTVTADRIVDKLGRKTNQIGGIMYTPVGQDVMT